MKDEPAVAAYFKNLTSIVHSNESVLNDTSHSVHMSIENNRADGTGEGIMSRAIVFFISIA
jgi:hypothetical protein